MDLSNRRKLNILKCLGFTNPFNTARLEHFEPRCITENLKISIKEIHDSDPVYSNEIKKLVELCIVENWNGKCYVYTYYSRINNIYALNKIINSV